MAGKYDDGDENVAVVFDLLVRKDEENHLGTIKKKKDFAQFAPAPDTLLQRALDEKGTSTQEVDDGIVTVSFF